MEYKDRVILIKMESTPGMLGDDVIERKSKPMPCMKNTLSHNEQMGVFGKYQMNSFKIHLQGIHKDIDAIIFDGEKRMISALRYHKHSTVIYI